MKKEEKNLKEPPNQILDTILNTIDIILKIFFT
jgi:hypothetical protein